VAKPTSQKGVSELASTASSKRFNVNSGVDSGTIGRPAGRADGTAMVGETHPQRVIARC
jgi:hypothetical protein